MHDPRCDRDLCHPACEVRAWAVVNDRPYPGRSFEPRHLDDVRRWFR